MKWFAISGSWRVTDETVEADVRALAKQIILEGNGIVVGGAPGVDYYAVEEVLTRGDCATQLKIMLPIKLNKFCAHLRKRSLQGVIAHHTVEELITQLTRVYSLAPHAIIDDTKFDKAEKESYYSRNTAIVKACKELYAFWVNKSEGTQDAINKAKKLKKKVHLKKYKIKV